MHINVKLVMCDVIGVNCIIGVDARNYICVEYEQTILLKLVLSFFLLLLLLLNITLCTLQHKVG